MQVVSSPACCMCVQEVSSPACCMCVQVVRSSACCVCVHAGSTPIYRMCVQVVNSLVCCMCVQAGSTPTYCMCVEVVNSLVCCMCVQAGSRACGDIPVAHFPPIYHPILLICACVVDPKAESPGLRLLPPLCTNVFTFGKLQLMSLERHEVECLFTRASSWVICLAPLVPRLRSQLLFNSVPELTEVLCPAQDMAGGRFFYQKQIFYWRSCIEKLIIGLRLYAHHRSSFTCTL